MRIASKLQHNPHCLNKSIISSVMATRFSFSNGPSRLTKRDIDRWRDNTALHLAASHDPSANCLGLLLKARAGIDTQNRGGYTALHLATEHNSEKCVALLVSMGANRDLATHNGLRPQVKTVNITSEQTVNISREYL
jgi:ankyrin repeat protein